MPNIKSSTKRMELSNQAREKNRAQRSRLRTAMKRVRDASDPEQAEARYREAASLLDHAARTRLVHPNKADRLKGQLARHVNKVATGA